MTHKKLMGFLKFQFCQVKNLASDHDGGGSQPGDHREYDSDHHHEYDTIHYHS